MSDWMISQPWTFTRGPRTVTVHWAKHLTIDTVYGVLSRIEGPVPDTADPTVTSPAMSPFTSSQIAWAWNGYAVGSNDGYAASVTSAGVGALLDLSEVATPEWTWSVSGYWAAAFTEPGATPWRPDIEWTPYDPYLGYPVSAPPDPPTTGELFAGDASVIALYAGDTAVTKMYAGTVEVWP